jgi:hypothetical protein
LEGVDLGAASAGRGREQGAGVARSGAAMCGQGICCPCGFCKRDGNP